MNLDLDKALSDMNLGRMAEHTLAHMVPLLNLLREQHLKDLKADFRAGKFDPVRAQSKLAAICDLDDLEKQLTKQVARGNRATFNIQGKDSNGTETTA